MSIQSLSVASMRLAKPALALAAKITHATERPTVPASSPNPSANNLEHCLCKPRLNSVAEAVGTVAAQAAGAPDLQQREQVREAAKEFARALMQALGADAAGREDDGDDSRGRGHGHRHHDDHGLHRGHWLGRGHHRRDGDMDYRAMQVLAQRIEALAQAYATAPVAAPAPAPAPAPVVAPARAVVASLPAPVVSSLPAAVPTNVTHISDPASPVTATPAASQAATPTPTPVAGNTATMFQDRLLDAFSRLRELLQGDDEGAPAPTPDTLRSELRAFLERLAGALDDSDALSLDEPTAPGALIDLAA